MTFLDESSAAALLKEKLASPGEANFAVAFWGAGAADRLGLTGRREKTTIICNLSMGGTNPAEVEFLAGIENVNILQNSSLHAKVYLFEESAVIGSSNASSNGLSFQDSDGPSWSEANILIEDPITLAEIRAWFDRLERSPITSEDIDRAMLAWRLRRQAARPAKTRSLLDVLVKEGPSFFSDREAYLAIYNEELSDEAITTLSVAQDKLGKNVRAYEDWPGFPKSGHIVNFLVGPRSVRFDEFSKRVSHLRDQKLAKGETIQLCFKEADLLGFTFNKVTDQNGWAEIVSAICSSDLWEEKKSGPNFFTKASCARRSNVLAGRLPGVQPKPSSRCCGGRGELAMGAPCQLGSRMIWSWRTPRRAACPGASTRSMPTCAG